MKASYNWLKEFVDFDMEPEALAHALTMSGLEVEAVETADDDTVLDIGVTPNRPDCLSIRGIAREISAVLDIPFRDISVKIGSEEGQGPSVSIENEMLCPRYASRIVSGVKPGPSPEWLAKRLESCGIRPLMNIIDVTNYVLLEIGQPMHAFDLARLEGKKIVVKQAGAIGSFTTLDNEEKHIPKDALMIWDAEKPVAVAGVMGGMNTEVSESTVDVLLESACFDPSSVRRTSRSLNLSTESSYRFERGIDKEAVTTALDRAAQLILEIAGGRVSGITDEYPGPFQEREISVAFDKINSVTGVDLDKKYVDDSLRSIGCRTRRDKECIFVTPPSYRDDIERDIDVVEEVARLYGYENIPSTLPVMQMSPAPRHRRQELIRSLKNTMVKSGFFEVINYSFLNPDALDVMHLSGEDRRRGLIYVKNPLRKEDSAMRTTLVPALLQNVSMNLSRGVKMLRFFEVSNVFLHSGEKLPREVVQMGAVFHKAETTSIWQTGHEGFYDMKGVFENIFADLKIRDISFVSGADTEPYLHPGKSCSIMIGGEKAGSIGVLHPSVAGSYDITGDITIAELNDIEKLLSAVPASVKYSPLPKFPYVERDVALIVDDQITAAAVQKEILSVETDLIEGVELFDIYKGKPIPEDKKSIAFSIRYRSAHRTLTDSEVDDLHARIRKRLQENLAAELRS